VGLPVQGVREQPLNRIAAIDARWQADRVDQDQRDRTARGARALVRRIDAAGR
jgi:hypothetical protein